MYNIHDIFKQRTCYKFSNKVVSKDLLCKIYDDAALGPTSGNSCPLRLVFVESSDQKSKLLDCLMEGNIAKSGTAPVIVLFAYDENFHEKMDYLNPHGKILQNMFIKSKVLSHDTAYRNSSLQAAYFMLAARGYGLACGPISGFYSKKLEETFFKDTNLRINFICNLGYPDRENQYDRLPRLDFDNCCKII